MNEFKFSCPHCDQHLQVAEELGGRQFQCPGCNHLIRVPRPPRRGDSWSGTVETGRTWDTFLPPVIRK